MSAHRHVHENTTAASFIDTSLRGPGRLGGWVEREPSVDEDGLSSEKGRFLGQQETGGRCHLLGVAGAPHRYVANDGLARRHAIREFLDSGKGGAIGDCRNAVRGIRNRPRARAAPHTVG